MIIISAALNGCEELDLGRRGENLARQIRFDIAPWRALYGDGSAALIAQRSGDAEPYPVATRVNGDVIVWDVTDVDTAAAGRGRCELQYYVGEALAKSQAFATHVARSLEAAGEPPDAYEDYLAALTRLGAEAAQDAADAAESAERAAGSATAASESAAEAGTSETNAGISATSAASSAVSAASDATAAQTARAAAESARSAAETAKGAAETAATNAAGSASAAAASETNAAASRRAAAASETNAAASATSAGQSATSAAASESAAGASESAAKASETAAKTSESNAASSAISAATSATNAAASATAAGSAETAAEAAQTAAETAQATATDAESSASASAAAAAESAAAAEQAAQTAQGALGTKADKVSGATTGHVAALDVNGNLMDNGNVYQPVAKDDTMVLRVGVDSNGRLWASGDSGSERFGAGGVGGSSTTLTRLWDAVGLTATPGTDMVEAQSDFDDFPVFNRKKCVGSWSIVDGKAVFTVQAYEGDADYAEDGSMGDYVAVDVPPTYWYHDEANGILGVSGNAHPGWEAHPVCVDGNGDVRPHTYLPCYALALKDGHAVSLPGLQNCFGTYKGNWDQARTYGDGTSFANFAIIEPSVVDHYEWLLQTIEFATTDMQTVMQGSSSMPYDTKHTITAAPAANKVVLTAAIGDLFSVGQTIYIGAAYDTTPSDVADYNCISAIENCDADGTLNDSGTYRLITYDGTDRTASITAGTTEIASRPWITGATQGYAHGVAAVLGHTGSPVSNTDAKHPMLYRWRENVYGNQNMTCLDLFDARTADGSSYHLDWYYNDRLRDEGAKLYYPSSASMPGLSDLQNTAKGFRKLDTTTPVESYVNGYIKEEGFDADLPCIRVPTLTTGGSSTTFYADYAYLATSNAVRTVRRRGYVADGRYYGPRYVRASYAPSAGHWYYGSGLYMVQYTISQS